jgi:hypothetical protein
MVVAIGEDEAVANAARANPPSSDNHPARPAQVVRVFFLQRDRYVGNFAHLLDLAVVFRLFLSSNPLCRIEQDFVI